MITTRRPLLAATAATLLFGAALPGAAGALAHPGASGSFGAAIYAGMQNGGLYRSTDGGQSWQEADGGLPSGTDITALVEAPNAADTLYAGTNGSGVYISTDAGQTWRDDNGGYNDLASAHITGLAVDPHDRAQVYAAAGEVVYRSGDGGQDWLSATVTYDHSLTALALDPQRPSTLVAGSDSGGLWYSTDGGINWNQPEQNLPDSTQANAIAFNPRNADVAYAATADGIYQTIDGGQSWQQDQRGITGGITFQSIAVDPRNGAQVIAGATDGSIYRSTDGGTSWGYMAAVDNQVNALLFDPARSGAVVAGVDNGSPLYVSGDNGADWQHVYPYLGANGSILCLAAGAARGPLPTDPVPAPYGNPPGVFYVSASHHTIRGAFLSFYNRFGNLMIFGLPLTEAFSENGQTVQYFERARMVYSGSGIRLTPLGSQVTAGRYFPTVAPFGPTSGRIYFYTGHSLAGQFLTYWRKHNGGYLFGAPISEPLYEQNGDGTGRTYLVQYFQNARLEYHPELAGTRYVVQVGQLGRQVLKDRGWLS